jgi:hypothetical protein
MPIRAAFKTDKIKETQGVWVKFILGDEDWFEVKIARAGGANSRFDKAVAKIRKPYETAIKLDAISGETLAEIARLSVTEGGIIQGWRTWDRVEKRVRDGEYEYDVNEFENASPENLQLMFKEAPDLLEKILNKAYEFGMFREQELEADAKN